MKVLGRLENDMVEPLFLDIYLDGSAYKNPGHEGGTAAIAHYSDQREPKILFADKYHQTTNNRMELLAVIKAIECSRKLTKKELITGITLWTDSRYVYDNYNRAFYWRSNKGLNQDDRIIENFDLWKRLLSLRSWSRFSISLEWNKGKTTEALKDVDQLAKRAAKSLIGNRDFGYNPGRVSRSKTLGKQAATLFNAAGQSKIIRIYSYELKGNVSIKEYKIKFDLYSPQERKFVGKYIAYKPALEERNFHRHHFYNVAFNNNSGHPVIEILSEYDEQII